MAACRQRSDVVEELWRDHDVFLDPRDRSDTMWVLFLTTGVRRGELAGLRWDDVDLDRATMAIVRNRVSAGRGKMVSTRPHLASFHPEVELLVEEAPSLAVTAVWLWIRCVPGRAAIRPNSLSSTGLSTPRRSVSRTGFLAQRAMNIADRYESAAPVNVGSAPG